MGESESEDSENEGSMGNVTRVVMRPPGHSGKAKKGHLCFDASFETGIPRLAYNALVNVIHCHSIQETEFVGNLGFVDLINQHEYDLFIRPDTCNPRVRLWFNFTIDNIKADQRVLLNIINFSKRRNCFLHGMTPLVKSTSRPTWQRMPNSNVFYYSSPNHNYNYVLSLAFNFDREDDVYQFALCYPYSYSKCQAHLEMLEKRNLDYFKRELLGLSLQKRRIDLLTITDPKNMTPNNGKVHVVVILGRIHPGESPASYVLQALIDYLVSDHGVPSALRDKIVFKIIPMLNPDGVFLGNHRCSLLGLDLNRSWSKISKWLHPTLNSVYSYIVALDQDKNIELDFILDIHAHSYLKGAFIYGNTYENVFRYERHIVFPKLLSQNVLGFERAYTVFNRDSNKSGSARRVFCDVLKDSVNCYSLNISFYGYYHAKSSSFKYYTEDTYYRVGRNIVQSFCEYYRSTGVLHGAAKKIEKRPGQNDRNNKWKHYGRSREVKRRHSAPTLYSSIAVLDFNCSRPMSQVKKRSRSNSNRRKDACKSGKSVGSRQQPSLTIIDFNSMARDLDRASRSNRLKSTEKYL